MTEIKPNIYIVDDDPDVRHSVGFLVSSVGYTAQSCSSAPEFLRIIDETRPCCAILDVRLPGLSGLELQAELQRRGSSCAVIFISGHGDIPKAVRAMRGGALDFLEKPFDDQVLLDRIEEAISISAEGIARKQRQSDLSRRLQCLTEREREVLALVIAGQTNKAIALTLNISVKTVENHRHSLMLKAGVNSLAHLIAWASEP